MTARTDTNPIANDEKAQRFIRWALDQKSISTDVADLEWSNKVDGAIEVGSWSIGRDDQLRTTVAQYRLWLKEGK